MQRLAQIGRDGETAETEGAPQRSTAVVFFALGLLGGALAGGTALAALELVGPAQVRAVGDQSVAVFTAALAPWISGSATPSTQALPRAYASPAAKPHQEQLDVFEVVIDRGARANAAFGLRLVGTEDESLQVLLRDVPAGAVLSHGRQRNASTWMVGAADLKHLHLTLNEGTPEAFDIRIDVLARGDVAGVSSVARVRLVEMPGKDRASVAAIERAPPEAKVKVAAADAARETPAAKPQVIAPGRNRARENRNKTASVQPQAAAVVSDAVSPPAEQRHWPEGASALGAVAASANRQVWWKMPPPTWSPFKDPASEP